MAKGYKGKSGSGLEFQVFCGACLRGYVSEKYFSKSDFVEVFYEHCADCYNCIGHSKKSCKSLT